MDRPILGTVWDFESTVLIDHLPWGSLFVDRVLEPLIISSRKYMAKSLNAQCLGALFQLDHWPFQSASVM